jgi:hypothetical protein
MTIAVPTYGFARQRFYPRKNPSQGIVTVRRYKHKNIHIANEERQVFIKRKFDDYKSSLSRHPKSAKYS